MAEGGAREGGGRKGFFEREGGEEEEGAKEGFLEGCCRGLDRLGRCRIRRRKEESLEKVTVVKEEKSCLEGMLMVGKEKKRKEANC